MEIEITYCGVKLRIVGDYQPYERATLEYPGCQEEFTVNEVYAADSNIDIGCLFEDKIDMIAISALEEIKEIRHAN